ncbi:transglycosylase domain-containing protein [Paractinoplanes durhamensis]|uniref:transglycosylase domain-containing protein n=1 Tax=Paractinoplanes durhamensis TaxID=113563 RepID=UPI00194165A8|nr:transglycosylase domain-containing protein [Actinoplanes durhamensis]
MPFAIRRRERHPLTNVSSLLFCGLLAGVVVAAAALPATALSGLVAKAGAEEFASLPSELTQQTSPQMSRVYAADGKTQIAVMYDEFRSDVPLKDISVNMQHAIVAAEDHKFYEHHGVDFKGLARAFVNNQNGGDQQGASTLTMQVVRMSLAYSATSAAEVVAATAKTPERKVAEMKYALELEKQLTKEQILERYLNVAPFGNRAYGIYAASQVYFGKKPKDLDVAQSALLAGMVKGTTYYDPTTTDGYPRAKQRRDYVVNDMLSLGYVTADQATKAKAEAIPHNTRSVGNGCTAVSQNEWGFFCDYFQRWWLGQSAFGDNEYDRERKLKTGGYKIVTTLDLKAQKSARKRVLQESGDNSVNALLVAAVQPGTGKVMALAANRKFKLPTSAKPNPLSSDPKKREAGVRATYPNTTNPIITGGGDIHGYQAGSVFKMFTMVAALEDGVGLDFTINTVPRYVSPLYRDSAAPAACNGHYCPSNSSAKELGPYNMWTGFGASVNTYFVPLQEKIGAEKVVDVAKRFGVQFREKNDNDLATQSAHDWGAFTLGVSASTPLDIANAYATLAADGKYCAPTPIQQITTHDGEKLKVGAPSCKQATTADVARSALDAARCPVGDSAQLGSCGGTGTAKGARGAVGHPIFGKTGTTDSEKTAALVVGTQDIVVAGYLVNPDWQAHTDHMKHDVVNPAVWNTVADYMKDKPDEQFKRPGE